MSKQSGERVHVPSAIVVPPDAVELRSTLAQVDDFLAMLAHELRQPLAAALAATEIQKHSPNPERQERARRVIEQQLRYIARLVGDLSEVSRISRGAIEIRRERFELCTLVREVIAMAEPMFEERAQKVTSALAGEPAFIYGDVIRVKQILSNLLKNAAAYTPNGGDIAIRVDSTADQVRLCVKDTGAGIEPEALEEIFQLFHRGVKDGDRLSAGIGLAVVRRLAELHGASVSAASDGPGHGSEFTVVFPRDNSN